MPTWIAGETLTVGSNDFCAHSDIQTKRTIGCFQIIPKEAGIDSFILIPPADNLRLISGRIDQGDWERGVIECCDWHTVSQTDLTRDIGARPIIKL